MNYKLFAYVFLLVLIVGNVSAYGFDDGENVGVFKQGTSIDLIQTCANCTNINVTSIQYPNGTRVDVDNNMSIDGTVYNYTYNFPSLSGDYVINGIGNENGIDSIWNFKITLSASGTTPSTSQAIMHGIILFVLILFLILTFYFAVNIDGKNEFQMGRVVKINFAKYLKQGLYFLSYLLLTFASGMAWVISENYLNFNIGTMIFDLIFTILWIGMLPVFIMFVVFSLIKWVLDLKLDQMKVRNLPNR